MCSSHLIVITEYSHKNICRGTSSWFDIDANGNKVPSSGTRDFDTIEEMNQEICKGLEIVGENDVLLHCGDVAFGGKENIANYVSKCKGDIILCYGNHDHMLVKHKYIQEMFKSCAHRQFVQFKGQAIVMDHFPSLVWHRQAKGAKLAYGHCHSNLEKHKSNVHCFNNQMLDVGVDNAEKLLGQYRPFSFKEFMEITQNRPQRIELDHH